MNVSAADNHRIMEKVLRLEKPSRMPMGAMGYMEYRKDIYNRGEPELAVAAGEVGVSSDGRRKFTSDGGVWATGAAEEYGDYEKVLAVDPSSFTVEVPGEKMLGTMAGMAREKSVTHYPVAWHYGTLVTRATIEFGWNGFLMAAALEPGRFKRILDRFGEASLAVAKGWAATKGVELVIIHDDIASTRGLILSPDWLREYAFPWHKRIFDAIHERGKKVLYISDGNYLDALPDIMSNGPDGFYVESSSMDPGVLMNIAGRVKLYLIKTDSRITDYGSPVDIREELLKLRELHNEFPGMMIYRGGGSVNEANAREFDRLYAELLIYD